MIGKVISHYKVLEKLGEGGMGVVYKAHDTKLDRFVALKFLPAHLNASVQDKARFTQEAKAAAALNHPNVCSIIDIQEHDERMFIVMEFVDGQILREKMGSLSMKQAIEIGIQIADGLAAAHEKGIVHRDIKPENIMIRKDGIAQIMDFGLAKLRASGSKITRLTKEGSTVGTAGYMSPEQIQGQETDHRSDIFSLGVVLYELFTGQLPFRGVHETALLYEIVNVDPPLISTVKPEIDPELDRIVFECLQKEPSERCQSTAEISKDLKRFKRESSRSRMSRVIPVAAGMRILSPMSPEPATEPRKGWNYLPWGISAISTILLFGSLFFMFRPKTAPESRIFRTEITLPPNVELKEDGYSNVLLAVSNDGKLLAYVGTEHEKERIYLRPLDQFRTTVLEGTDGAKRPFFSPDGKWIGFFADKKLKKVLIDGGAVETICDVSSPISGSWDKNDTIFYCNVPNDSVGHFAVPAGGGVPQPVALPDESFRNSLVIGECMPGSDGIICTRFNGNLTSFDLLLLDQKRHQLRQILAGAASGQYANGYLFFTRQRTINAVPFDLGNMLVTGDEFQVVPDALISKVYNAEYAVGGENVLAYIPSGTSSESSLRRLVWVDREGKITEDRLPPAEYADINLSLDGKKVAFGIQGSNQDVWVCDLSRGTSLRISSQPGMDMTPCWTPDGKNVLYAASEDTAFVLVLQKADGTGTPARLNCDNPHYAYTISPDGRYLAYLKSGGSDKIWISSLSDDGKSFPLLNSAFDERNPAFSPDGHWIAYQSDETNRYEIYVIPFQGPGNRMRISNNGGEEPRWARNGKELFYRNGGKMMAVRVETTSAFHPGDPTMLFEGEFERPGDVSQYDVSPDGQHFLMLKGPEKPKLKQINVVLNWKQELKKK